MSWKHILVPTDFSEPADAALGFALDLAEALDASVTVFHAYHVVIPLSVPPSGGGFRMPGHVARELRERAEEAVAGLVQSRARPGLRLSGRAVEAPPAPAIIEEAMRLPADLIVMGTRGLTGLKRIALGSVAKRVIQHAPCPVLTLHARET
jgi:nucleotide-binding universal stress UspA family protein